MSAGGGSPPEMPSGSPGVCFGPFELRPDSGELLKDGVPVRLRHQSFEVLALLAERPGRLVTREEIQARVWGPGTHVDFDQGLNHCVKEIRAALGDHAENPEYVETLARRGYRFIAPATAATVPPAPARWRGPAALVGTALMAALAVLALWRLPARPPEPSRVMIAVLPFDNLSGDPEQDYFAAGLTEELIAQIGRLDPARLGVVGRAPALEYQERPDGLDALRRDLGVRYVLEGSVRRSGDRARITARLTQLSDKRQVWAETYETRLQDILAVQRSVAEAVGGRIRLAFSSIGPGRTASPRQVDPEAYLLFLKGRFFWNKRESASARKAIEYFERSIARQPDYAMAYVGVAQAYVNLAHRSDSDPARFAAPARAAAVKALELDTGLAEARVALAGVMAFLEWDWAEAERELRRGLDLNPSDPTGHHWYSHILRSTGRVDQAFTEIRTAASLAPLSLIIGTDVGNMHLYRGDVEGARRQYRAVLDMDPRFGAALRGLGRVHLAEGRPREAVAEFERAVALGPETPRYRSWLGYAYAVAGRREDARRIIAGFRRHLPGCAYDIAAVHAGLGERDTALDWLERAYRHREPPLRYLLLDERLRGLRDDPRFRDLARRVGLFAS